MQKDWRREFLAEQDDIEAKIKRFMAEDKLLEVYGQGDGLPREIDLALAAEAEAEAVETFYA